MMNVRRLRIIRHFLMQAISVIPLGFSMKLAELLRGSQGFGSGAVVATSGEIRAIKSVLGKSANKRLTILDVGANRGEYSLGVLPFFKAAQVFAFELSPTTFELLEKNLKNSSVIAFNYGLGNENKRCPLFKNDPYSRMGSLTRHPSSSDEFTETVQIRKLDEVFPELDISMVDFLKIDVEGHELDVLNGARKLLEGRLIQNIQFEFGGPNLYSRIFLRDIFEFLHSYDFSIHVIKFGRVVPLSDYLPRYEVFSPTNFIAKLS